MKKERSIRTEMVIGEDGLLKLANAHVAVFGLGGVGSYVAEALARTGVGRLTLVDGDTVSESNINRQLIALGSTIGKHKTQVAAERIKDINPDCTITEKRIFYGEEENFPIDDCDYVVDAIDTVSSKLFLIKSCRDAGVKVISSMGTGNKLDPCLLRVGDIFETKGCPLARVMRKKLREAHIDSLKVVYSTEENTLKQTENSNGRHAPGSVAFVPGCAGLILASQVIKDILLLP